MKFRKLITSQRGFGLTEVMISVGIMSVMALGMASLTDMIYKGQKTNRTLASRDDLKTSVDRFSKNFSALKNSATNPAITDSGNLKFRSCITGIPTSVPCDFTETPFILLGPLMGNGNPPQSTTRYSGLFDANGIPCMVAGPECPIVIRTTFTCAAPCSGGTQVFDINYSIDAAAGAKIPIRHIDTLSAGKTFQATVSNIITANASSGTGNMLSKWDSSGNSLGSSQIFEDDTGKIGIGTTTPQTTLDVNGGIRPGSSTTVTICDATTEGQQRYNYTAHALEYCGGSPLAWIPVKNLVDPNTPVSCTSPAILTSATISSSPWTPPAGVTMVWVTLMGGGGGGGANGPLNNPNVGLAGGGGGGGGAGCYVKDYYTSVSGPMTVTIGQGGAGGVGGTDIGTSGSNGGATFFGGIGVPGGQGGAGGRGSTYTGGAGGASGGNALVAGSAGGSAPSPGGSGSLSSQNGIFVICSPGGGGGGGGTNRGAGSDGGSAGPFSGGTGGVSYFSGGGGGGASFLGNGGTGMNGFSFVGGSSGGTGAGGGGAASSDSGGQYNGYNGGNGSAIVKWCQ